MAKKKVAEKETKKGIAEAEAQPDGDNLINRIYLIKKTGVVMLEGPEAEADIKSIQKANNGDDKDYTFYENGVEPVYIAVKNGNLCPLTFPVPGSKIDQGQSGMTSMELYALTVTLPETIEKIIELETEPKPSLLDQAKKIMTPTLVIVGAIIAIFLLAVIMKG